MIVQLNENVKCNAKRKIKNICIYLLLFFFAFAIMIRYQRCGALAQLVEQAFRCSSPLLILHQKAVNVKSTQNLAGIFGAIAQLVERTNSNASPLLILYQKAVNVKSAQNLAGIFGAIAQLVARYIRIVEVRGSNPLSSTKSKEVEPIKWFGFFLWHGYCAPCFTTGKFIEEAVAVVDDRLAALLEKS